MVDTVSQPSDVHDSVRRYLAEREIRYTPGRRSLVTGLLRMDGPVSVADLQNGLDVPLSSLYRSLTVLDDLGVVVRHHDTEGLARYELAEWLRGHHHHLVCIECGTVEDVELSSEDESVLDGIAHRVAADTGFSATGHNLEIKGVCPTCRG